MSVYELKSRFQNILRPISNFLALRGVTANQVTIAAMGLSFIYGGVLCLGLPVLWLFLPAVLFLRMAMNAIDGLLAREHNMRSKLGMALNEIGDILSDIALLIPFLLYGYPVGGSVFLFMFTGILTETCGLLAYMLSGERRYDGPMGKSDRAVVVGILGIIIGSGYVLPSLITGVFLLASVLAIWTCYRRISAAL